MPEALLQLQGISKRYAGVRALDGADLSCHAGEIHAVLGENGAGKSTLIKAIAGVVQPDAGRILMEGAELRLVSPNVARDHGIACVFQELSLVPDLSVAENIFLARPPRRHGLIDAKAQQEQALALLDRPSQGARAGPAAFQAPADRDRQGAEPAAAAVDPG
jgi:ribose transport system ATP-binding protein